VPRFEPFIGIRYDTATLDPALVTAPPYDVISPTDRAKLVGSASANVVRIDLPIDGEDPYSDAARQFAQWRSEGVLVDDDQPSFTAAPEDSIRASLVAITALARSESELSSSTSRISAAAGSSQANPSVTSSLTSLARCVIDTCADATNSAAEPAPSGESNIEHMYEY
jgi:hypothetical protein